MDKIVRYKNTEVALPPKQGAIQQHSNNSVQTTKKVNKAGRINILWGFIGTNRTGKSVTALEYAEQWRASRPPEYQVIAFDPQKRFEHIADRTIAPEDKDWANNALKFRNSLLILDDYRIINESDRPVSGLANLMYYRADYNLDIIYICHNPGLVINTLTYFTTHYFLFYTEAMDESFKKKIMNYNLCIKAQRMINNYVTQHGRGAHPNSPEYNGQDFPYIIVDCEKRELFAINMEKNIHQ